MKLTEALKIVRSSVTRPGEPLKVYLACGFIPLHLSTFLAAELAELLPERRIEIEVGLYGDLTGNLRLLKDSAATAGAVVIEWADLDPRLGLRSRAGWGVKVLQDVVSEIDSNTGRVLQSLAETARTKPLSICLPTLPLPPLSYHPHAQAGGYQLQLAGAVNRFALAAAQLSGVKIVNSQTLDHESPLAERLDVKAELATGFPYRMPHASKVAAQLARLIQPRPPRKGLITDLDDTLWRGLVGEEGVAGVSWDLDGRSHIHALYQQLLGALSESGALVAVASKNDPAIMSRVFDREDLLMPKAGLFPVEINWQPKSQSVSRILKTWNISADSVVFVDDSPLELAEVRAAHPEMECLLFPRADDEAAYQLFERLRDLFGKEHILEEDAIRAASIRRAEEFLIREKQDSVELLDTFLEQVEAELSCYLTPDAFEERAFELINKTNQFNLNGRRFTRAELQSFLNSPDAFFLLLSYRDKYGPLGKIAVLLGQREYSKLKITTWVMSCRAFGRRIEHKSLDYLFEKLGIDEIEFDYVPTDRNKPLAEFLCAVKGAEPGPLCTLTKGDFVSNRPALFHEVKELVDV